MIDSFRTSITDVRSLIKTVTLFFDKIGAGLVTGGTGSTLNAAEYDFSAYICFSALVSVNAEVVSVKESFFMIPITYTMELRFFRNSSKILALELGDIFKGTATVEGMLNVFAVFKGKMFLVTRNIFAHRDLLLLLPEDLLENSTNI